MLAAGAATLRASGSPTPRLDAELLIAHATGRDRSWVLAHPESTLAGEPAEAFRRALDRRATGEPIAYIRGFKDWLSLRILTDARALVPRPETEVLAQAAIAEIEARLGGEDEQVVAWEVATGSGAVAVALALRFRDALGLGRLTLIASDASPEALELAGENLTEHGVGGLVTLLDADLLSPAGGSIPRPEVVVANLPYLSTAEVDAAAGSLAHEPRVALEGGRDGLELLRRLFAELPHRAAPGATVLLEVALGQADAVSGLAPDGAGTEALPDLGGVARVVVVRLPS
ncbi:MAG: peptide chain release factor N(5)-glutamine methyltransferase [Chloroflexi bacterium]|nr:peptide chain release factor N(5)-glutamine methyltransferase [Chloroflexota bacterium]